MSERALTCRQLNRALLARQLLLDRRHLTVARAVARLAGLQAQYTPSPYLTLLARLDGFDRDGLTRALERRRVVKALLMRGTLHIVVPNDYWAFTTARKALGTQYWPPAYERQLPQERIAEIARATVGALRAGPQSYKEVRELLETQAIGQVTPVFLWRRVQGHANVIHVPPSGTWGYHGAGVYEAADTAIGGGPPSAEEACDHLVRSYLAAFGPATPQDIAQWAGLQRLGPLKDTLSRMELRRFVDERGRALLDLPRAPLPDPETPAPPRLLPRFDNLVLSHEDRTRILGDVPVSRIVTKNALVHATILVDGFVSGTWRLERGRVRLEPFARLPRSVSRALKDEAARIEAFAA